MKIKIALSFKCAQKLSVFWLGHFPIHPWGGGVCLRACLTFVNRARLSNKHPLRNYQGLVACVLSGGNFPGMKASFLQGYYFSVEDEVSGSVLFR